MSVEYRPGRIQSLNADQEVVLKQVYAYFLKYYGYSINIPDEDLPYKECFISSTRTTKLSDAGFGALSYGLVRTSTKDSTASSHISHRTGASSFTLSKKKKSAAAATTTVKEAKAPVTSKRIQTIQSRSSLEKYEPISIDPKIAHVFINYYKQNFENSDDYMSDNEDYDESDADSISSFVTAETSIEIPDMKAFANKASKNGLSTVTKGALSVPIEEFKVKPQTSIISGLNKYDPKELHRAIFGAIRNDAFDNFVLRFVRARKFITEASLLMITKSLDWRTSNSTPDEWSNEGDALSYVQGINKGFVRNYTSQKSYVRGYDKERNPIFFFKAKLHLISESPLADTQRFAVTTIEHCRLFLRDINDSVDQCSIVFDLTGFSLKNADYNGIKFLAEIFEAQYPECLGKTLIYNAPWIFSTVWNVIKNWLDPVVASKIHFTKNYKELSKFIDPEWIPDYMGGEDHYAGDYPVPTARDATWIKPRDANFVRLKKERDLLFLKFLTTTKKWIESTNPEISDKYLQDKIDLCSQLAHNYVELDPYVRLSSFYDRNKSLTVAC